MRTRSGKSYVASTLRTAKKLGKRAVQVAGATAASRYIHQNNTVNLNQVQNDLRELRRMATGRTRAAAGPSRVRARSEEISPPNLMLRSGRMVKRRGAAFSKSAGKFKRPRYQVTKLEKLQQQGGVICFERAAVLEDANDEAKTQSIVVGHATFTRYSLYAVVALGMARFVAKQLDRQIQSWTELYKGAAAGDSTLTLYTKQNPYDATAGISLAIVSGTTRWIDIARWFYDRLSNSQQSEIWVSLQFVETLGAGSTNGMVRFSLDMTRARVQIGAKSSLKIQNRTVNVAANAEEDDVDNVPLYGKQYMGPGNYDMFKDTSLNMLALAPGPAFSSSIIGPAISQEWTPEFSAFNNQTSVLAEPQPLSKWVKANKIASAKLDPGHIKTSVLQNYRSMTLSQFFRAVNVTSPNEKAFVALGDHRFYHFEKMIQAQPTSQVKSIRVAYELDYKIGGSFYAPKKYAMPNMIVDLTNA